MSYIEIHAKKYASKNLNNFDKIIKKYNTDTKTNKDKAILQ